MNSTAPIRTTPESAFTLSSDLTSQEVRELSDTIIARSTANLKALAATGEDLNEGFTIGHGDVMDVLWGIEGSFNQLRQLAATAAVE